MATAAAAAGGGVDPRTSSSSSSLRECLHSLGLPPGLLSSVTESHRACDSRLWLLDNSSSMRIRDSHVGRSNYGRSSTGGGGTTTFGFDDDYSDDTPCEIIERVDNVTRWIELRECVLFHSQMASKCWIPSKYWFVHSEGGPNRIHKFSLCWTSPNEVKYELDELRRITKLVTLENTSCPLTSRIHGLCRGITKETPRLQMEGRRITVMICTQGLPTDKYGNAHAESRKEFQKELVALSKLPVRIIVRLCTDDERVRDMFNTMDSRFDCLDVLDDYWGESIEVYLHNPWLTYSLGLHRLREAGLAPDVLDDVDERPLDLDEIHQLCKMLFLGDEDDDGLIDLPHPSGGDNNWDNFLTVLNLLVEKERMQWNPVKRRPMPWINVAKLDSMHGGSGGGSGGGRSRRSSADRHPPPRGRSSNDDRHEQQKRRHRHTVPQGERSRQQHQQQQHHHHHPRRETTAGENSSRSSRPPPPPPPQSRDGHPRRQTAATTARSSSSAAGNNNNDRDNLSLTEVLQNWSHGPSPPDQESSKKTSPLYPLERLLVTIPNTFPPKNTKVEEHEYFAKWKTFDGEAFADESGDELKELLKRAVRKAKFFLHPDKLPKDLTESQIELFRTLWDVIAESEEATIG